MSSRIAIFRLPVLISYGLVLLHQALGEGATGSGATASLPEVAARPVDACAHHVCVASGYNILAVNRGPVAPGPEVIGKTSILSSANR